MRELCCWRSSELWFRGFAGRGWTVITLTTLLTLRPASLACVLHWPNPITSKGISEPGPYRSTSSVEQVGGEMEWIQKGQMKCTQHRLSISNWNASHEATGTLVSLQSSSGAEWRYVESKLRMGQEWKEELLLREGVWGVTGNKFGVMGGRCELRYQALIHDCKLSKTTFLIQNSASISQYIPIIFQNCKEDKGQINIKSYTLGQAVRAPCS